MKCPYGCTIFHLKNIHLGPETWDPWIPILVIVGKQKQNENDQINLKNLLLEKVKKNFFKYKTKEILNPRLNSVKTKY